MGARSPGLRSDVSIREVWVVYFFQAGDADRYALSVDKTGCNIPLDENGWFLRGEFELEDLPDDFAPAIENLAKFGFSILRVAVGE